MSDKQDKNVLISRFRAVVFKQSQAVFLLFLYAKLSQNTNSNYFYPTSYLFILLKMWEEAVGKRLIIGCDAKI